MDLNTARLVLRPLRRTDAPVIRDLIFSDAEVAKGLAHDISRPAARTEFAEEWCRDLAIDGDNDIWAAGGIGGFAITANSAKLGPQGACLGVVGVYGARRDGPRWTGELFYALGRRHHGRRIMTEACVAVRDAFAALQGDGLLYAVYWEQLNPASGRILRRLGFEDAGHRMVLEEYDAARALSFRDFELWRLRETEAAKLPGAAREAAIKLGHLAREGLLTKADAFAGLAQAVSGRLSFGAPDDTLEQAFDLGAATPAMALLKFSAAQFARRS